jgi:DNA-binding transcriptional LysR family regulator
VALIRLPADTSALAVIPLYEEATVAVVPADHLLGAALAAAEDHAPAPVDACQAQDGQAGIADADHGSHSMKARITSAASGGTMALP